MPVFVSVVCDGNCNMSQSLGFDHRNETYGDMLDAIGGSGWKVEKDGKDLRCPICAEGPPANVYEKAARTEARDLIMLFAQDPAFIKKHHSDFLENGTLTFQGALRAGRTTIKARYVDGKCTCCDGDALVCAERHAESRSCG
jgi:hypothetical protein